VHTIPSNVAQPPPAGESKKVPTSAGVPQIEMRPLMDPDEPGLKDARKCTCLFLRQYSIILFAEMRVRQRGPVGFVPSSILC